MLVGVDSGDSLIETLRGHRIAAVLAGLGFGGLLVFSLGDAVVGNRGLERANAEGNVPALGRSHLLRYVFAFEVTSALLITAAVGAMVLAHRESIERKLLQRELSVQRFQAGRPRTAAGQASTRGTTPSTRPALLPDGTRRHVRSGARARGDVRRRRPTRRDRGVERGRPTTTAPTRSMHDGQPGGGTAHEPDELRLPVARSVLDRCRGVLLRRNAIVVFMCVELMLNAPTSPSSASRACTATSTARSSRSS
jgi:hypothetical protein